MPRVGRTDTGSHIYHVINRSNTRVRIFDTDNDYQLFEIIVEEGKETRSRKNFFLYGQYFNQTTILLG